MGMLKLRLDTPLADVRSQLVTLAGGLPKGSSKRGRKRSHVMSAEGPESAKLDSQVPPLAVGSEELRLHPFDFTAAFQFVFNGGVTPVSSADEETTRVIDMVPAMVLGDNPYDNFLFQENEVGLIYKRCTVPPAIQKKYQQLVRANEDGTRLLPALTVVFVRQGAGRDNIHSENVIVERLLMENNLFGRQQTPANLATLIDVHNANARDFMFRTILQECTQEGNISVVEYLLELPFVDVECIDWRKQTSLHLACERGHFAVVQALLKRNANCLVQDAVGQTPVHLALYKRHDTIAALLEMKLQQDGVTFEMLAALKDQYSHSPPEVYAMHAPDWLWSCRYGNIDDLRRLYNSLFFNRELAYQTDEALWATSVHFAALNKDPDVIDFVLTELQWDTGNGCLDVRQRSPLHYACQVGHTEVARRLLQYKGINPNQPDINGYTPLHTALYCKKFDTAMLLVTEAVIDPNVLDRLHHTPLHIATDYNCTELVALLVQKHKADPNARFTATVVQKNRVPHPRPKMSSLQARKELYTSPLKRKSLFPKKRVKKPVYTQTEVPVRGPSALQIAVRHGPRHNALVHFLLMHGAGTSAQGSETEKRELLCHSLDERNFEVSGQILQLLGLADLTSDASLLHRYCIRGDHYVMRWLVEHGSSVNALNAEGFSPVSLAAKSGDVKAVQFLLDRGADPNVVRGTNHSLLLSIAGDHRSVTSLLVYSGAELGLSAGAGILGALHLAASLGHLEAVKSLVGYNVDINLLNGEGRNALWVALQHAPRRCSTCKALPRYSKKQVPASNSGNVLRPLWMVMPCNRRDASQGPRGACRTQAEVSLLQRCDRYESIALQLCERGVDIIRGTSVESKFFTGSPPEDPVPDPRRARGGIVHRPDGGRMAIPLASGEDDAEERLGSGRVQLHDNDLDFESDRIVGLRFDGVGLAKGTRIAAAALRFVAQGSHSGLAEWNIHGQAAVDAPPFSKVARNLSTRPKTGASVVWAPTPWSRRESYLTADLGSILQEIINNDHWTPGNAVVFLIRGSGERDAYAYDGDPTRSAVLHIEVDDTPSSGRRSSPVPQPAQPPPHPLEYTKLAASKGYWDTALATLRLMYTCNPNVSFTSDGGPLPLHARNLHVDTDTEETTIEARAASEVVCGRDTYSYAAEAGRADVVRALLSLKVPPQQGLDTAGHSWTAADYAAASESFEVLLVLLVLGVFPTRLHSCRGRDMRELLAAVEGAHTHKSEKNMKYLHCKGPKVFYTRKLNPKTSVLHELCKRGNLRLIRRFVEVSEGIDSDVVSVYNGNGKLSTNTQHHSHGSPLYLACRYGHRSVATYLLDAGFSGAVYNDFNPLLVALHFKDGTLMQRLVEEAHVDVNTPGNLGNDGLGFGRQQNHSQTAPDHLLDRKTPTTPLYLACSTLACDSVTFLLSHGAQPARDGGTAAPAYDFPLHGVLQAAPRQAVAGVSMRAYYTKAEVHGMAACSKICTQLLETGVNPDQTVNSRGQLVPQHPLNLAAAKGYSDIVTALLDAGATLTQAIEAVYSVPDVVGSAWHVVHHAARHGWVDVVRLALKECGPLVQGELMYPPDAPRRKASSSLVHIACRYYQVQVIVMLLANGAVMPPAVKRLHPIRHILRGQPDQRAYGRAPQLFHMHSATANGRWGQKMQCPHVSDRAEGEAYHLTHRVLGLAHEVATKRSLAISDRTSQWGYLHAACARKGYLDVVKMLVEAGCDINASYQDAVLGDISPLFVSISVGDPDTAKYLLQKSACTEGSTTNPLRSPLVPAILNGDEDMVRRLVEHGVSVNAPYQLFHSRSEVQEMTKTGSTLYRQPPVEQLMRHGKSHVVQYCTPLFAACYFGMESMVYNLFSNGANMASTLTLAVAVQYKCKPAMTWCRRQRVKGQGSRARARNVHLLESMASSAEGLKLNCLQALLHGAPDHPLKITVKRIAETGTPRSHYEGLRLRERCDRYVRLAKFVIARGVLVNLSPTALSLLVLVAASKGYWEIAAMILKEGPKNSDPEIGPDTARDGRFLRECSAEEVALLPDVWKRHPLHVAAEHAGRDLFAMFLKRSQKQDISVLKDPKGHTAIQCAILVSNIGVVELLINLGVDLELRGGPFHRTALHMACRCSGNIMIVTMLLKAGVDINAVDSQGCTALMHAAEMGRGPLVELLSSSGADVGVVNTAGYTALMLAAKRGHVDIALPLLQYWTRKEALASNKSSVLHCACEGGCVAVIEYLLKNFEGLRVFATDVWGNTCLFYAFALGWGGVKRTLFRHLARTREQGPTEDSLVNCSSGKGTVYGWFKDCMQIADRIREKNRSSQVSLELSYAPVAPSIREASALLMWAAKSNHAVVAHVLGDHCIVDDCYALHVAAERGYLDLVQILLQLEMSNINTTDKRGRTALMRAIQARQHKTALFLLSRSNPKKLMRVNKDQQSLFHLAAIAGGEDMMAHLLAQLKVYQSSRHKNVDLIPGPPSPSLGADGEKENRRDASNLSVNSSHVAVFDKDGVRGPDLAVLDTCFDAYGHTPFEYAMMFGHAAVALRITFTTLHAGAAAPRLPVESGFLANCSILSPASRSVVYDFFGVSEVANMVGFGPSAESGVQRLTWPDVRSIGLAQLRRDKWALQRLQELQTLEYEKRRYKALVQHLEIKFRLKFDFDTIECLSSKKKMAILQRLATSLFFGRFSLVDPIKYTLSAVELEYVPKRSQVGVSIDNNGVLRDCFHISENTFVICGDLMDALEGHFKAEERLRKLSFEDIVKDMNRRIRGVANPFLRSLKVTTDWKSFDSPLLKASDRQQIMTQLLKTGIMSPVSDVMNRLMEIKVCDDPPFKGQSFVQTVIVWRRAQWNERTRRLETTHESKPEELPILVDMHNGEFHLSLAHLQPLFAATEAAREMANIMRCKDNFLHRVSNHLPDLKFKVETEGDAVVQCSTFQAVLTSLDNVLAYMLDFDNKYLFAPQKKRPLQASQRFIEVSSSEKRITFSYLLHNCIRNHLKGIRLMVSKKREPAVKYSNGKLTICINPLQPETSLPSERWIHHVLYTGLLERDMARMRDAMLLVLTEMSQRLQCYLPSTNLVVDWGSFDCLDVEFKFLAMGVFFHAKGAKVLQQLVSGMSVGWDSKLGGVVRKHVSTVTVLCTNTRSSWLRLQANGQLYYHAALAADYKLESTKGLLTTQEIASHLMMQLEKFDPSLNGMIDDCKAFSCWGTISGKNLKQIIVGRRGTFTIHSRNILNRPCPNGGEHWVVVLSPRGLATVHSPYLHNGGQPIHLVDPKVLDKKNGSYEVQYFAPTVAGRYDIHVTLNGVHLPASPIPLRVFPGPAIPVKTGRLNAEGTVMDPGQGSVPTTVQPGKLYKVLLQTMDDFGNHCTKSAKHITFAVGAPSDQVTTSPIVDLRNGQYSFEFKPKRAGTFSMDVSANGAPIDCSPFPFCCTVPKPEKTTRPARPTNVWERLYRAKLHKNPDKAPDLVSMRSYNKPSPNLPKLCGSPKKKRAKAIVV